MKVKDLSDARKAAEAAVAEMPDGALKISAFETILRHLLSANEEGSPQPSSFRDGRGTRKRIRTAGVSPTGTSARITSLTEENFFAAQRSLSEIQAALAERGWHYRQNNLSTPLTRLVRRKVLRRTQISEGSKRVWKYSVY